MSTLASVILSSAALLGGAQIATQPDPIATARVVSPLVAHRSLAAHGKGLLVADFRPDERGWTDGSAYVIELTPSSGGAAQKFPMIVGQPQVLTLEAGRYCLSAIEHDARRYDDPCVAPFYDVSANSVDFTGRVDFHLRGSHHVVTARALDNTYLEPPLSAAQRAEISSFLDEAAALGTRTLFVSSPPGLRMVIRMLPSGAAELEEYAIANSSYDVGAWTAAGTGWLVGRAPGRYSIRVLPHESGWRATEINDIPASTGGGVEFHYDRRLAVSTRPECWHWTRCGDRWPSGVIVHPDYTFGPGKGSLAGRIELEFGLKAGLGAAQPDRVKVVSTTLTPEASKSAQKNFADSFYSLDLADISDRRYRQVIEFGQDGQLLSARLSDLTDARTGSVRLAATAFLAEAAIEQPRSSGAAPASADAAPSEKPKLAPAPPPDAEGNREAMVAESSPPRYPAVAIRKHHSGIVRFKVRVGADGAALEITLAHSSGHEELDESALQAVRQWRFHPRLGHGQPVEATIEVPVTFSMK